MKISEEYFGISWPKIFGIITALYLIAMWLSQSLVNEIVYFNTYSEQLSYDRAMELYGTLKKSSWIAYPLFPVMLLVKISTISLVLYIGVIFLNLQKQISPGMMFRIVTASEIIFVFAAITKVLWFSFFAGNYTLNDINFFYPVSLANLFNPLEVDRLWVFPLQTINLYHLLYILMLMYGIRTAGKTSTNFAEKIVTGTYLPALFVWVALIMFLTVKY